MNYYKGPNNMESKQKLLLDLQITREVIELLQDQAIIAMDNLTPVEKAAIKAECQARQKELIDRALAAYQKESNA